MPHSSNDQTLFISYASNMTLNFPAKSQASTEALITSITIQNQLNALVKIKRLQKKILQIYTDCNAYKITYVLQRNYGIHIKVGRVYRLMKTLPLPRMSTENPYHNYRHKDNGDCSNHFHQEFNQKSPNLVWTNNFTYIKAVGKWYYLCIVMDMFSRKVISWNISEKTITLYRS